MYPKKGYEFNPLHLFFPMPADLGYHSPKPMYEDHNRIGEIKSEDLINNMRLSMDLLKDTQVDLPPIEKVPEAEIPKCEWLGVPCYYDGSSLNADPVYKCLIEYGEDAVWGGLEEYYIHTFGELK